MVPSSPTSKGEAMADLGTQLLQEEPAGSPDRIPTPEEFLSVGNDSLFPGLDDPLGNLLLERRNHPVVFELRNLHSSHR